MSQWLKSGSESGSRKNKQIQNRDSVCVHGFLNTPTHFEDELKSLVLTLWKLWNKEACLDLSSVTFNLQHTFVTASPKCHPFSTMQKLSVRTWGNLCRTVLNGTVCRPNPEKKKKNHSLVVMLDKTICWLPLFFSGIFLKGWKHWIYSKWWNTQHSAVLSTVWRNSVSCSLARRPRSFQS